MVFPVVMYGCEGWTVKKAESRRNWCFWSVVLEKTLESPLDCKEIQPVHSEDQPWDFFGSNDAKAEAPVLWPLHVKSWLIGKDSDAGRDWGPRRRGRLRMRWLDGITDWMDVCLSELREMLMYREAWRAVIHGVTKSSTQLNDWIELLLLLLSHFSVSNSLRPHRWQPTRLPCSWDSPRKNTGVDCHLLLQCIKVKSEKESLSKDLLFAIPWTAAYQAPSMGFSWQEYWSGLLSGCYFIVALFLHFSNDVEHLCIYLLITCISLWWNIYLNLLPIFKLSF